MSNSNLSNSEQGDEQTNHSAFRENANEPTVHSSRSKKKVQSAPTSAVSVRHVKRSSSLTVIYMDELQNVADENYVPRQRETEMSAFAKLEDKDKVVANINSKHHLKSMLPISRKQSQVAPTSSHQLQLIPLEEIAITEPIVPNRVSKTDSIENGASKKLENLQLSLNGIVNLQPQQQGAGNVPLDGPSNESFEEVCRICHDNPSRMTLLSPCLCKGSMGKVHRVCLERWLGESAKTNCEICGHEYETERRPRYSGWRSVVAWIRNPLAPTDTRNLFFDLACFFILTPLAAISAWLCVVGAKHYSFGQITLNPEAASDMQLIHEDSRNQARGQHAKYHNKNIEASNSTWTSIGLLTLTGTLLAAYYVWLFVAIRYHIQVWREWQARNFVVTISPLNPERIIQLREARAAAEVAEIHDVEPERQQASVHTQNPTVNNNNNNNGTKTSCSSDDSNHLSSNNNRYQQRKMREKTLARAFEDTFSMESNGTISTEVTSEDNAGPSNFKPNHCSDVDSVQGKVIIIPSEASFNANAHEDSIKVGGGGNLRSRSKFEQQQQSYPKQTATSADKNKNTKTSISTSPSVGVQAKSHNEINK